MHPTVIYENEVWHVRAYNESTGRAEIVRNGVSKWVDLEQETR